MSFSRFKETIEEGDTVILYIGVSQIYALEVRLHGSRTLLLILCTSPFTDLIADLFSSILPHIP